MDANPAAASLSFTDRGDPAANDYTQTDFTRDNAYHDLDLSAIVGANACLVLISVHIKASTTNEEMKVGTSGNSNDYNTAWRKTISANVDYRYDIWVWTDAAGKIQYKFTTGTYVTINFNVRGWFV